MSPSAVHITVPDDFRIRRDGPAHLAVHHAKLTDDVVRARHEWPPVLDPPTFWDEPFAELAQEVELPVRRLEKATREARAFIEAIDAAYDVQ